MATLNFTVAYFATLSGVDGLEPSLTIYAEDLGLCSTCVQNTESCFACLQTNQQVFNDGGLTYPVDDGYYLLVYANSLKAIWHIEGGYPQEASFYN